MTIVLGIDGGGTKTTGMLAGHTGEVLAEVTVGATNPNSVGKEKVQKELSILLEKLREIDDKAYSGIKHVFAGIAGASHVETRIEVTNMIKTLTKDTIPVTVNHDAISALYSGTLGEEGIVQIAGTGAVTYGVTREGVEGRVGGWGHLFSDHGSGYSIGRDALEMIFLAYDGHPIETSLTNKILAKFQVEKVPDIVRKVYHSNGEKTLIASISKLVLQAADEGDSLAKEIVKKNGNHLGKSMKILLERLFEDRFQRDDELLVVLVGGLFNRLDLFKDDIHTSLGKYKDNVRLKIPELPAVGGCIIAALKEEEIQISEDFVENFNKNRA